MKIVKIRQDQFDKCEHLDQLGLLERAYLPGYTVYACVEENGGDEDRPCAMLMFFIRNKTLTIEWLYVESERRGEKCADLLLSTAFEMQETGQIKRLAAYLPEVYGRRFICPWEEPFLSDYFGGTEVSLMGEWNSTLMALGQHPKCLLPERKEEISFLAFSDLSAERTKEVLSAFLGMDEGSMLYSVHELTRDFDRNTSFAAFDGAEGKNSLCGGLLTHFAGETLYIVCLFGSRSKICTGLWTRFVKAALQQYPGRMRVAMILRSEKTDRKQAVLLDDLFQVNRKGYGRHIPASLLYLREEEDAEDMLFWDDTD
jgi:hypothetical protein